MGAVCFAAACKKKTSAPSATAIRNISREFVFAARNASGGRADVGMRPEYEPRRPGGKAQSLVADHIYITIPVAKPSAGGESERDAIEAELARVADYHHLQRVPRPGAPGVERFDYVLEGRRTQSIHLITPVAHTDAPPQRAAKARLAVVVDDLGNDRAQAEALFKVTYPLTISVLPHEPNSSQIAEEAHRLGYEVMLHLPMASNAGAKEENIELHPGMPAPAVEQTLTAMLDTVPYAAGVNNHEGSLGTSDPQLMDALMPLLRQRSLFFIDSRTTAATVAEASAHAAGVATASRNVFLDDEITEPAIRRQFDVALREAHTKGAVLAIGHPHPETISVLSEMLPEAEREGIRLVFASDLAR